MSDLNDVMESLEDLIDDFDRIPRIGFGTYRSYSPAHLVEHDPRAAAACIYSHMVAEAERRFTGRAGIVPKDIQGQKVWIIRDVAVIRWKKHDEDGRSRNYPTKQALAFDRGLPFPELPPPAVRLSVGYLVDATATEFIRVQVAKPIGRRVEWCAAIVPEDTPISTGKRWIDVTRQRWFP